MHGLLEFDSTLYCLFQVGNPVLIGYSELCMKTGECAIRDHHFQFNERECQDKFIRIVLKRNLWPE